MYAGVSQEWEIQGCFGQLKFIPILDKEQEAVVWHFKGKAGNSWVYEEEHMCDKQIFVGQPETMGQREGSNEQSLLDFSLWATFSFNFNDKAILCFYKQVFLSELL